jgi:hypothetical protein
VILPVLWKTILYNQQSPRAIKHNLKGKSIVLWLGSARKFLKQIIVVITAAVVGVSAMELHLRYMSI